MTTMQKATRTHPNWFTRFWAIVRYEMLWNIRKKKFIGVIIIAFVLATLGLVLPSVLSSTTGTAITANPTFAITYGASSFGFFLFALATAMNSISSEFETGTIVPLLTKPVSRTMVFLGKLFAAFIIILISYAILFTYTTIGSIFVYGPQNNLQLVPLVMLGNLISTFIWVSLLLAIGSVTKNTIITVLVAVGLFLALFIAIPIVSVFAGPSSSLNYLPGNGASGTMLIGNKTMTISTGTDNLGINLANYVLYPSTNVNFSKIDISAIQAGQTTLPTTSLLYTEPISLIALRALGIAAVYTIVFLLFAWITLKRSEILE
jgi:Cu-processing system permease protein